jgi:hypothetical protein
MIFATCCTITRADERLDTTESLVPPRVLVGVASHEVSERTRLHNEVCTWELRGGGILRIWMLSSALCLILLRNGSRSYHRKRGYASERLTASSSKAS